LPIPAVAASRSRALPLGFCPSYFLRSSPSNGAGTNGFFAVMCRVFAKHVKPAFKLSFGFVMAFIAIMSILDEREGNLIVCPRSSGEMSQDSSRF